jgi:hypothetical protein
MQRPKLRDNKGKGPFELYPLGQIPNDVIYAIGKYLTYYFSTGRVDLEGRDWGDIFAKSIGGEHLSSPLGLADVVYESQAWSVKTIKKEKPHSAKTIRLISGRNSTYTSYDTPNPHENIAETGKDVLSIWNERINVAKDAYEPLRTAVLIRNFISMEFLIFEQELMRYDVNNYEWRKSKQGTIHGYDLQTQKKKFTWQPSGSQFTVFCDVPPSARKFTIKRPPMLDSEKTMNEIGFNNSWITIL